MKIIIAGDPIKAQRPKRFKCNLCGCVFEAYDGEYDYEEFQLMGYWFAFCPTCGQKAYEKKR